MSPELVFFWLIKEKDNQARAAAQQWKENLKVFMNTIRLDDIRRPEQLATVLGLPSQDQPCGFVQGRLSTKTEAMLHHFTATESPSRELVAAMVDDLNSVLRCVNLVDAVPVEKQTRRIEILKSEYDERVDQNALLELNREILQQTFENELVQPVAVRDADSREEAVWIGQPFVLVGRPDEINSYFAQLTEDCTRVLCDHAYYWVLTDSTQDSMLGDLALLPTDRIVILDWNRLGFNVVRGKLAKLTKFPRLTGLSREISTIRDEITRIALGPKGPWSPTLILGASGTGKEEVARSLYDSIDYTACRKDINRFGSVACGWFTAELLQDQLFGHAKGAFTGAFNDKPGLLEIYSDGALLLNDFDSAPPIVQGALLGVLATRKDEPALILRLGAEKEIETWVWLILSTNADIQFLLDENRLREDFVFRLGDRIVHIPPLLNRAADIPALAHRIWDELWRGDEVRQRRLSSSALKYLIGRTCVTASSAYEPSPTETRWEGNVRALQALLSLTVSMARMLSRKHQSIPEILEEIMGRGPEYRHWVGIVATPSFRDPPARAGNAVVRAVLALDERPGSDCFGPSYKKAGWPATGSEKEACKWLKSVGRSDKFEQFLGGLEPSRSKKKVRASVRLSRGICYAYRKGEIDKHVYHQLTEIGDTTAAKELLALAKGGFIRVKERGTDHSSKVTVYEPLP